MKNSKEHPVWYVYNGYRTARLNVKYYSTRLHRIELMNKAMELCIAITAPGSGFAKLFSDSVPPYLWQVLLFTASVAAILKPVLKFQDKIKKYQSVLNGYRGLEYDLVEIKESISQKQAYDKKLQSDYIKALKRERDLEQDDPETTHDRALIIKCQAEVNRELPPEEFFVPKNNHQGEKE
jgi:hypothetical protein